MEVLTVHDQAFYIDGGDCVIRVDNVLFKVHRFFLCRDSSTFQDMFNMAPDTQSVEGCSDENPIHLFGESVERFRALLSVIYDMPLQIQIYNTPGADVERLLMILEVANKYNFASIEMWAVNTLFHILSRLHGPPQAQYDLSCCSSPWMKRVFEVALLCNHTPLLTSVVGRWVDRIATRDLRPIHALDVADRSGSRQFQGYAYYVQLLEMDDDFSPGVVEDGKRYSRFPRAPTMAGPNKTHNGKTVTVVTPKGAGTLTSLTREQRERLLLGYWSLSRLWDRFRLNAPSIPQSEVCTVHQRACTPNWTQAWGVVIASETTLEHLTGDVLGRLRAMDRQLVASEGVYALMSKITVQCRSGALAALRTTIKDVEEGLADHFALRAHTPEVASTEGAS